MTEKLKPISEMTASEIADMMEHGCVKMENVAPMYVRAIELLRKIPCSPEQAIAAWNRRTEPAGRAEKVLQALSTITYLAGDIEDDNLHNEIKDKVRIAAEALFTQSTHAENVSIKAGESDLSDEPDQALLISMACCLNHGFGMDGKERQESQLYDMRKLYNEMAGRGYYKPENRERYLSMLNDESYQSPLNSLFAAKGGE